MSDLLVFAFLFFIGSCIGWVLEVFFRKFFSKSNPDRKCSGKIPACSHLSISLTVELIPAAGKLLDKFKSRSISETSSA